MSDDFVPPWLDKPTLMRCICVSDTTVDTWVEQRIIPPGRKRGGKTMWKWKEVDQWLTDGPPDGPSSDKAKEIRDATQRAAQERRASH